MENISSSALEAEIAALQQKIESKKNQLEVASGIIEETGGKELLDQAVRELFTSSHSTAESTPAPIVASPKSASYLDRLDDETATTVGQLVEQMSTAGIAKTVATAEALGPFALDALHDLLVDRLYEELRSRGIIK